MNRRRLRNALELAREVIECQCEEIELLEAEVVRQADEHNDECAVLGQTIMDAHAERDAARARVATLEADPRAGLLEDVAERLGLPRPADERVVAAVVGLIERVATLEGERDEAVRLLADEHATHHPYCCVDGDDLCHIGQFRALLDVAGGSPCPECELLGYRTCDCIEDS